jgi:hypothetical protein
MIFILLAVSERMVADQQGKQHLLFVHDFQIKPTTSLPAGTITLASIGRMGYEVGKEYSMTMILDNAPELELVESD